MAEIKDSTAKIKTRSSRFLGCFGFSKKVPEKKMYRDAVKSGCRKKTRWLSWSRFRTKKSVGKTVPVDTTVPENPYRSREIHSLKSDEIVPAAAPVKTVIDKPHKRRYENAQNIVLESRESLDSMKDDTCQRGLPSTRKKEAKRSGVSHPSSPENRSKSGVTNKVLSHSVSFPMPKGKNQAAATGDGDSRVREDKTHQESDIFAGKLDQVVGMSIIMVTLIIMVIWGKLCAILCTSAWFYFVPRLRKSVKSNVSVKNGLNSGDFDMNSEEYKKKVVLEGLLRRNHRSFVGFL